MNTLLAMLCIVGAAHAEDQIVVNDNDSGVGSLRQAIQDVHDGGTITFADDFSISLQSDLPLIQKNVEIKGRGCRQTIISGGGSYRIFEIWQDGTLKVSRLTVCDGENIECHSGTLEMENVEVYANTGYGGGIRVLGTDPRVTIRNSLIHGNTATNYGGGLLCVSGETIVTNTTIFDNTADDCGGGICITGGKLTLDSCTIAHNKLSGNNGSGIGGGIGISNGTLEIQNTIVANNQDDNGDNDYYYSYGTLTDNGYNFVEVSNTSDSTGFADGVNNNIVGTDPIGLASDISYEGGWTKTLKITAGTFTGGNYGSTSETSDQRGYYRKSTAITRGAYQYEGIVVATNPTEPDNGYTSIANAVAASFGGETLYLANTPIKEVGITIDKILSIMGSDSDSCRIWGSDQAGQATDRILTTSAFIVYFQNVAIQHGKAADVGGGILVNNGELNMRDCVVSDNVAGEAGGGVYGSAAGKIYMLRCSMHKNRANSSFDGGAIFAEGSVALFTVSFLHNTAQRGGGAFFASGAQGTMQNCTFTRNTATGGEGGAIYNSGNTLGMYVCIIDTNRASGHGGGIYNASGSELFLDYGTIRDNKPAGTNHGGGVYNRGILTATRSTFTGNSAHIGGGLVGRLETSHVVNCTFYGNTATEKGGAICSDCGSMSIANCTIVGNSCTAGIAGGVVSLDASTGVLNSIIVNNVADSSNDLARDYGYLYVQNSWFEDATGITTPPTSTNITTAYTTGDLDPLADHAAATQTMHVSTSAPAYRTGIFVYYNDTDGFYCQDSNGDYLDALGTQITPTDPESDKITIDQRGCTRSAPCNIGAYQQPQYLPIVTTAVVSNVTGNSADCGGEVTHTGTSSVTERGICWNTIGYPTTTNSTATNGDGLGSYTCELTGLTAGTTYYVRAYATNSMGTGYGEERTFTTATGGPDLRITVTPDEESSHVGEEVGFDVDVQNVGTASATGVALRLPLPQGTEFVGIYPAADQTSRAAPLNATVTNGIIEVVLGDVAASQLLKLELVLKAITAGAVTLEAAASCTESATPATAQAQKDVSADTYLVITRTSQAFNACGMLGIMSPLLSIAGMLAMRRRRF